MPTFDGKTVTQQPDAANVSPTGDSPKEPLESEEAAPSPRYPADLTSVLGTLNAKIDNLAAENIRLRDQLVSTVKPPEEKPPAKPKTSLPRKSPETAPVAFDESAFDEVIMARIDESLTPLRTELQAKDGKISALESELNRQRIETAKAHILAQEPHLRHALDLIGDVKSVEDLEQKAVIARQMNEQIEQRVKESLKPKTESMVDPATSVADQIRKNLSTPKRDLDAEMKSLVAKNRGKASLQQWSVEDQTRLAELKELAKDAWLKKSSA